jgi:hypothetical protein
VEVTIESAPIFLTGVIKSSAQREPQRCFATLRMGTQPIKRARPAEYKIKLRTLSRTPSYPIQDYANFYRTYYTRDVSDPRFLKLTIFQGSYSLDEKLLMEGSSPRDASRHAEGIVTLKAQTFDWWIPVKPPFHIKTDFARTMADMRAAGWGQAKPKAASRAAILPPPGSPVMSGDVLTPATEFKFEYGDLNPKLFWQSGDQDWEGQIRAPNEIDVKIDYKLDWMGDRLDLQIRNDTADRNYVVFLVLEEMLVGTGNVLHTAVPIPVNGQLTYVPQKYFDEETAARASAARAIADFNERYSKSRQPGPSDPVVGWLRPGDLVTDSSVERFVSLAQQHQPELLNTVIARHKSQ